MVLVLGTLGMFAAWLFKKASPRFCIAYLDEY